MNEFYVWGTILGLTVVTLVTRNFFLVAGERLRLPDRVRHALRYAPACALAALLAPEVLQPHAGVAAMVLRPEFAGGVAGLATMLASRSMLLTLAVGLLAYTALRVL